MRTSVGLFAGLLLGFSLGSGCGPALDEDDLGPVLRKVPTVPGMEKPYVVPPPIKPPGGNIGPSP